MGRSGVPATRSQRMKALRILKDGGKLADAAKAADVGVKTIVLWKRDWILAGNLPPQAQRAKAITPNKDEKFKAFVELLRGGTGYLQAAKDIGITESTAYSWAKTAIKKGLLDAQTAVTVGPIPKVNPVEAEALRVMLIRAVAGGRDLRSAASDLGVAETTAKRWLDRAGVTGYGRRAKAQEAPPAIPFEKLSGDARACLEDFGRFRTEILGRSSPPWAVRCVNRLLELYRSPQEEYAVVNFAPGLGKSTLITHDFVIWVIALERSQGRETGILLGHAADDRARAYVKRVRLTLQMNDRLVRYYGRFQPSSNLAAWSTTELRVEPLDWRNVSEKENTVETGSYGRTLLSTRWPIQIWDDLLDKGNQATPEQRDAVFSWWDQFPETRVNAGGLLILSNARYGPDDLCRTLLDQRDPEIDDDEGGEGRPLYEHIAQPVHDEALCRGEETHNMTIEGGERIYPPAWPDGCLLDPKVLGWRRVRRAEIKDVGKFRLIWQQENVDPVGALAEEVWFKGGMGSDGGSYPGIFVRDRRFLQNPRADLKEQPLVSAFSIDPSGTNYWAIEHWLSYRDGVQALLQGTRRRMQAYELLYREQDGSFTGLLEDWWQMSVKVGLAPTYAIFEGNGFARHFAKYPFFRQWSVKRGVVIVPHDTVTNKADPERGVQMMRPLYHSQQVEIPYFGNDEKIFAEQFCREAVSFPEGHFSDCLMAHWFFNFKLPNLSTFARSEQLTTPEDVPDWAAASFGSVPEFVKDTLGGRPLDRGQKMLREMEQRQRQTVDVSR